MLEPEPESNLNPNPIVTFLANPSNPNALNIGANGGSPIDPQALSAISAKLKAIGKEIGTPDEETRNKAPRHMLVIVSSVGEIITWLNAYFPDNDEGVRADQRLRIQIVGHATSGALSLGASWSDPAHWYDPPFPILDSNPRLLVLLGQFVGCIHEVMLAGCQVASWRSNGYEVNGRTLLFTLAEMWKCKVRGAADFVDADSFDNTGWYTRNPVGWAWSTKVDSSLQSEGTAERDGRDDLSSRPQCDWMSLNRPDRITAYGRDIETARYLDSLPAYFNARLRPSNVPRLALPELEFDLHHGATSTPAALLCGGRFLMVGQGEDRVFYTHDDGQAAASQAAQGPSAAGALSAVRPLSRLVSRIAQFREARLFDNGTADDRYMHDAARGALSACG